MTAFSRDSDVCFLESLMSSYTALGEASLKVTVCVGVLVFMSSFLAPRQVLEVGGSRFTARWSLLLQDLSHRRQQLPHTDGLALEAIEASCHNLLAVLRHDRRRDGDDRDRPRHGIRTKFLERLDPVHAGELNVHEDQGGAPLAGQLHPLLACL